MSGTNGNGAALGREALARPALKTERVKVPEWSGDIILREMSAAQTVEFARMGAEISAGDPTDAMRVAAWALAACWVDESGAPVLGDGGVDDLLATQPADLINRLATRVAALSGLAPGALGSAEKKLREQPDRRFWHTLALAIGGCTIAELQARIGHSEFVAWKAYYGIEPFGGARADMQTALLASLIANANRDPKKRKDPFTPGEFVFDYWAAPAPELSEDDAAELEHSRKLLAKFRMLTGG